MTVFRRFVFSLLLVLAGTCTAPADDDAENPAYIELNADARRDSGIETIAAAARRHRPEITAFGTVLDITPLLDLRLQSMTFEVRHSSAAEKNRLSRAGTARLKDLHRNDAVSTRQLQEQLAQWQTDRAVANETELQHRMVVFSSLQRWGQTLTDWFTRSASPEADDIISRRKQLLQIVLPPGAVLPPNVDDIRIAPGGDRQTAVAARLVGAAPQVDPATQGRQYFFVSDGGDLPVGMRVFAWIPDRSEGVDGAMIPKGALLWHLGLAFVFVEVDDGRFVRRSIEDYLDLGDGYFVPAAIHPGERIVSSGAQTLLSQQLRARIPDEDDD